MGGNDQIEFVLGAIAGGLAALLVYGYLVRAFDPTILGIGVVAVVIIVAAIIARRLEIL